jgi:glycylpeptide N-tetradecanoyltransferase
VKFWSTQPVPQIGRFSTNARYVVPDPLSGEAAPEEDGPIELSKPSSEVRQDPYPLPKDFEWSSVDINDEKQVTHFVTDHDLC